MLISFSFLRSLLITSTFSFATPIVLISLIFISLVAVQQVPYLDAIGQFGISKLLSFLAVFGNGDALEGLLVIGSTCGLVGALFDTYAFYRQHSFRDS